MNNYQSIRNQRCVNLDCPFYKKELGGNIVIHGKKYPRFKCKICKKTWVTTINSKTYRLKKDLEKIEFVNLLLEKGMSIREIALKVQISPTTVQRWKNKFERFE